MQEIYLIETSGGSYEDYYTHIAKAFFNSRDAERYVKEYNENLKIKKNLRQECNGCPIHWYPGEDDEEEYQKWLNTIEQQCKDYCKHANITVRGKDYFECKNEVEYFVEEQYEAKIRTIAIE